MDHNNGVDISFFGWSTVLGALIGLGQILDSAEKLSWRVIVGRALVSAGLASMAQSVFFPVPPGLDYTVTNPTGGAYGSLFIY